MIASIMPKTKEETVFLVNDSSNDFHLDHSVFIDNLVSLIYKQFVDKTY